MPSTTGSSALILLLALVGCGERTGPSSEEAAAPAPGESYCRGEDRIAGQEAVPELDIGLGPAELAWTGDLNGDSLVDLILRFPEACGSYGDCPHTVLVGCSDHTLAFVWPTDYAVELSVGVPSQENGWAEIVEVRREGEGTLERRHQFDGETYRALSSR